MRLITALIGTTSGEHLSRGRAGQLDRKKQVHDMSESSSAPDAAPTPDGTPPSTPKSTSEPTLDAQLENGVVGTANSTPEPTPEFASAEKALYELGFNYQTFRFWAEVCWFEVGESPCNETRRSYWHVAEILEYLLTQMELDTEGTKCLRRVQQANNSCWNALREDLKLPERCQLAEAIRDGEPEFLTSKLWSQNTLLHRAEWRAYETAMTQAFMTLEEPLSVLVETGMIVAKGQVFGHGPPASRSEHFPIARFRDALLRLREHYPNLNEDALDVSESRLDGVATESQISLERAVAQCCEVIHRTLLHSLSLESVKTPCDAIESRRTKKKPVKRNTASYQLAKDRVRDIRKKKIGATRGYVQKELKKRYGSGVGNDTYKAIIEDLSEEERGKLQQPDSSDTEQ